MAKILPLVLIAGCLGFSTCAYMTMNEFRDLILPKCYDRSGDKELINGQVSPIPSSLETFISIVERLEERYSIERIIRSFIARFRFDDVLLRYVESGSINLEYVTRGEFNAKKAHEVLQDLLGNVNYEMRDFDLSDDEQCALYFMISHTVNDTVTPFQKPEEVGETIDLNRRLALKNPREQGVVNLNGKTLHAFALGKVLIGILAGIQDSERTMDAETLYKNRNVQGNGVPEYLKAIQINVLLGVTISDILAVTLRSRKDSGTLNSEDVFLPNGYWDDSVCPTKYILSDNNDCYATTSLFRGAIDGLYLGKKIKTLREMNQDLRLSQILRMYYNPRITSTDSSLSDISWCNRHSFLSSVQDEIIDQATSYYQLYTTLFDQSGADRDGIRTDISRLVNQIMTRTQAIFDDVSGESDECGSGYGSKICETPRSLAVVLDTKYNREIQEQIIGNLSVGFHMSPSSSFVAVYPNAKSVDKLPPINISDISGCASCAAKYYGVYDNSGMSFSTGTEEEVLRALNRTLAPDGLPDDSDSEPGVPSKIVIYFNYGNPQNKYELQKAISDFRYFHRGTKFFAFGSRREALRPFVENVDEDIFTQDVSSLLKPLNEKVCKVPAQFQYQNCYKNSRSDEDSHSFQGFITPNHIQYWAMYPKYFLKSYKIQMSFTTASGQIKVCFTRNYDEMYGTGQSRMKCATADGEKEAIFYESNPCKKYNVENCRPFYFSIEAVNVPERKCTVRNCRSPNQIEFEFKHQGISCNSGISFVATPMTLAVAIFMSIYFVFKH